MPRFTVKDSVGPPVRVELRQDGNDVDVWFAVGEAQLRVAWFAGDSGKLNTFCVGDPAVRKPFEDAGVKFTENGEIVVE